MPWLMGLLSLAIAGGIAGCTYERVVGSTWDVFADKMAAGGAQDVTVGGTERRTTPSLYNRDGLAETPGWAILVKTFEGRKHARLASQFVKKLQQETNMSDLWSKKHEGKTYVYRGRYFSPSGYAARDELRQTRMTPFDGERPFENIEIARVVQNKVEPGDTGKVEVTKEMDLAQYGGQDLYSLQVGVYDQAYGKDFRRAAETCAAIFRAAGDKAFFCHKPHLSMVTVGLFTRDDAFVPIQVGNHMQDSYSPMVRTLQKKHPYNLLNGRTIIEKSHGKRIGEQRSCLVEF